MTKPRKEVGHTQNTGNPEEKQQTKYLKQIPERKRVTGARLKEENPLKGPHGKRSHEEKGPNVKTRGKEMIAKVKVTPTREG